MENEETGVIAGKIWDYLAGHSPSNAMQIKLSLNITNSQLYLALGWLARENKISVTKDKNLHVVALRKT